MLSVVQRRERVATPISGVLKPMYRKESENSESLIARISVAVGKQIQNYDQYRKAEEKPPEPRHE